MTIEILRNNAINLINDYWKKHEDIDGLINDQEKEEVLGDDWEEEINSIGEEINWKELYKNERGIRSAIDKARDSLIDSINWEMPVIIENLDEEIKISDNSDYKEAEVSQHFKNYNGKRVIFRNCPNLKRIEADKLNLIGLEIENCPKLKHLSAYNNKIKKLDLSGLKHLNFVYVPFNKIKKIDLGGCKRLENLNCGSNQLNSLVLDDNKKLKSLDFNNNQIEKVKVKHLKKLELLHCYKNCLAELNCGKLKKLKDLNCHNNIFDVINPDGESVIVGLSKLKIKKCESLEILDCAENQIETLEIFNFPELKVLSCKENRLEDFAISNCPNLSYLDFSLQALLEWNGESWNTIAIVPTNLYIGDNSLLNLEVLYFTEEAKFLSISNEPLAEEKLSKIKIFECSSGEVDDFEAWLDKKRRQEQRRNNFDEGYESDDDTIDAANYRIPERKDIIVSHDLSHWNLTGELIIDGWANLKSLNVGNNELNSLVVRNCPNLKRLIYAHNKMPKEAKISGCNNLTEIDKENYNGVIEWKGELSETEKARIEILKLTEEYNDKVYSILKREEQGEDIDLDELARLLSEIKNPNLIDLEYRDKFISLYYRKIKERFPEQYKKQQQQEKDQENNDKNKELVIKIANLIEKAQQALKENNLSELAKILDEMKNYCDTDAYANNKEAITKLEQQLINATSQSEPNNKTPNFNLPLIIGFLIVSIGILALVLKFLQNKFKKMLKFR